MKSFANKHLAIALIIFISAISFYANAASQLEEKKQAWLPLYEELRSFDKKEPLDLEALKRKNSLLNNEYKARAEFLRLLAREYLKGTIKSHDLNQDFKSSPNHQTIMNQFSVELLMESIARLQRSKIPEIKTFMKKYASAYEENAIPLFRLSGSEINRESPTELKGGFHRGTTSIFMDVTRTTSDEWLFVLMHELYHALDKDLYEATQIFSNRDLFESVLRMSAKPVNLVELNPTELTSLNQWILAGLNRGLLAEYRAWSFGFSIYEKGIAEGLWKKIPFIEEVLSFKDKNESMNSFVYRYLNERSSVSTEGILGRAIIQEKIKEKREDFTRIVK